MCRRVSASMMGGSDLVGRYAAMVPGEFAAVAACGEAAGANLRAENVFIQGDIFCAGTGIGVAGGGCGIERHGVSHRLCG